MKNTSRKYLFLFLGFLSLSLGIVGIILPFLPTTPFALLAAYFFSKSSPRMHQWLLNHQVLGPTIKDWQESGVIRPKAKVLATIAIIALFSISFYFTEVIIWVKAVIAFIGVLVLVFIWTRPSK